ncbi:hypothetical protein [Candidatus Protochlamydia phocaeensis]|uniref:hypothetical protein n=1 Tax=Candidatus Protochlamydia phocaeensis TaxID=1414722 RepID=UPI0012AC2172|nr:hypothetical protein [Candidatus Protochlamydia phocaeensis]
MERLAQYINQMKQLFEELIQTATKLRDVSRQVISEEELAPLQAHQQDLLKELEKVDTLIQENYPNLMDAATHHHFHDQLQRFQFLNQEFIQNLNASHGLIQFELSRLREEEVEGWIDFNHHPSILKKVPPSPNSSQAIESQEKKEP